MPRTIDIFCPDCLEVRLSDPSRAKTEQWTEKEYLAMIVALLNQLVKCECPAEAPSGSIPSDALLTEGDEGILTEDSEYILTE